MNKEMNTAISRNFTIITFLFFGWLLQLLDANADNQISMGASSGPATSASITLSLPATAHNALHFLLIGDWGWPGYNQTTVANSMAATSTEYNASFVISLGDNFYQSGVTDIYDAQWNSTYRHVYWHQSLQIPWYSILGNHDYRLNPDAQVSYYTNRVDNRWIMPARYYSREFTFKSPTSKSSTTVLIVFVDTDILSPLSLKQTSPGGIHEVSAQQTQAHLDFIESTLAASQANWKLVAGHHCTSLFVAFDEVRSICEHGDNSYLISSLVPMMLKYGVQAYIDGHDHCLEHLTLDGLQYFVSGGGGDAFGSYLKQPSTVTSAALKFATLRPGYSVVSVTAENLTVRMIDLHGEELYQYTLNNPTIVSAAQSQSQSQSNFGTNTLLVVGIVVGALAGTCALVLGMVVLFRKYNRSGIPIFRHWSFVNDSQKQSISDSGYLALMEDGQKSSTRTGK